MEGKKVTDLVWLGTIVGLLGYEAYTLANKKEEDTLSESVWRAVAKRPLISFGIGALVGHFIWQSDMVFEKLRGEDGDN